MPTIQSDKANASAIGSQSRLIISEDTPEASIEESRSGIESVGIKSDTSREKQYFDDGLYYDDGLYFDSWGDAVQGEVPGAPTSLNQKSESSADRDSARIDTEPSVSTSQSDSDQAKINIVKG